MPAVPGPALPAEVPFPGTLGLRPAQRRRGESLGGSVFQCRFLVSVRVWFAASLLTRKPAAQVSWGGVVPGASGRAGRGRGGGGEPAAPCFASQCCQGQPFHPSQGASGQAAPPRKRLAQCGGGAEAARHMDMWPSQCCRLLGPSTCTLAPGAPHDLGLLGGDPLGVRSASSPFPGPSPTRCSPSPAQQPQASLRGQLWAPRESCSRPRPIPTRPPHPAALRPFSIFISQKFSLFLYF